MRKISSTFHQERTQSFVLNETLLLPNYMTTPQLQIKLSRFSSEEHVNEMKYMRKTRIRQKTFKCKINR
jgi:hypothetical protein